MNDINNITLLLSADVLASVNTYLKAGIKRGVHGYYGYLYKDSNYKRYMNELYYSLNYYNSDLDKSKMIEFLSKTEFFKLTLNYYLTSNINSRDLTNFTKGVEDTLVNWIKGEIGPKLFDDNKVYQHSSKKELITDEIKRKIESEFNINSLINNNKEFIILELRGV